MDKLNNDVHKKILGSFYTPKLYAEKSLELLREAINRVPKGNDYVIIDRCAGTGNLESFLSDEELSHCILSTIEYYEYNSLKEKFANKVRHIVQFNEIKDEFNKGIIKGADALSEEFVNNAYIKQYIDNPNCTIILFENPPYSELNGNMGEDVVKPEWKKSFVLQEMKKEIKGVVTNDIVNAFIWSAFKYYLRQDTDSYIILSPIKYWKSHHIIDKEFIKGFGFNRIHFNASSKALISCILWSNKNINLNKINLDLFDIVNDELKFEGNIEIKKIHVIYSSKFNDKTVYPDDKLDGIAIELNGTERLANKKIYNTKLFYNENIIAFITSKNYNIDNPNLNTSILISNRYDGKGTCMRKNNFLELIPLFSASRYIENDYKWYYISQLMKSADKYDEYMADIKNGKLKDWLLRNLFWVSLTHSAHIRSLYGSDGRFYRNELCLDNSNGETIATTYLKDLSLNEDEITILNLWNEILSQAKQTDNYNPNFTYGIYQIYEELNSKHKDTNGKIIYSYPLLNDNIKKLKALLKIYFMKYIAHNLFVYELLK